MAPDNKTFRVPIVIGRELTPRDLEELHEGQKMDRQFGTGKPLPSNKTGEVIANWGDVEDLRYRNPDGEVINLDSVVPIDEIPEGQR